MHVLVLVWVNGARVRGGGRFVVVVADHARETITRTIPSPENEDEDDHA